MKARKIVLSLFLALSVLSCKNDEKKPEEVTAAPEAQVVTFRLNAIVKQDDDFQIFYKEDNNAQTPFEEINSAWSGKIKGSETAQNIIFTMPEGVFPTQIRFDLGQNKTQPEITINSFKVSYKDKSFEAKGKDFFNFFIPDEDFVKVEKETSKVIPAVTASGAYDPMFFSNGLFNEQLTKITQ